MTIGIMLRHLGQHGGGVVVYTRNLVRELLALESPHRFVLLYREPRFLGTHADGERVREVALRAPSAFLWDQLAVRRAAAHEGIDLLFNPKYALPLSIGCRTAFVCHGLDWYVMPWASRWPDRLSHRFLIPRYARQADAVIAVSETTRRHAVQYLGLDEERVHTVYHGVDERFREPVPPARLEAVRSAHALPERFFLYCGQIYPPKNFGRLLRAYARVGPELGISLVVAGEHAFLSQGELALIDSLGIGDRVMRLGWVEREDLPALYALAEALCQPSLYESFGLPVVEAMASGCPVLAADRHGTREVAQGAALLVDPEDVEVIAEGLRRLATEPELRRNLVEAGRERALGFSWRRCARETLRVLEGIGAGSGPGRAAGRVR